MSLLLPHVAARVFNEPLMIEPGKLAAIMAGIGADIVGAPVEIEGAEPVDHKAFARGRPSMGRLGDPLGRSYEAAGYGAYILDRVGSLAIIPVEGTLVHKGKHLNASSGRTSYEGIQARVMKARRDPSVKAVAFEIDSYGGEVAGAFDTADLIGQLSAEKPTLAILTDHAYSAGYLLASAARKVILPESGGAGSIGVITMHADMSKQAERQGVKVTIISSGAHKADGHPLVPLDPAVAAKVQERVDAGRDQFAAAVAKYRGARLTKSAALATEAQTYRGEEAVAAGLADAVMRPSDAFEAFARLFS